MYFFEFWWKSNGLKFHKEDDLEIYGFLYSGICFWLIDLIILYNLPKVILGLFKLMKG